MDNKVVVNKINKLASEIVKADENYVYDPKHVNRPHEGGNWHKTDKGWSRKEVPSKLNPKQKNILEDNAFLQSLTSHERNLVEMSKSGNETDRRIAAESSVTPVEALTKLSDDPDALVVGGVAHNPNCPENILDKLGNHQRWDVRIWVAKNPSSSNKTMENLLNDKDFRVREYAKKGLNERKQNPLKFLSEQEMNDFGFSEEQKKLAKKARFTDVEVRNEVAKNPNTHSMTLDGLSSDEDWNVRYEVAKNKNTGSSTLRKLSQDEDWRVRLNVVGNPKTSNETLNNLKNDENQYVRKAANSK